MSAPVVCCTGKENFGREETEKKGRMGNRRDEENYETRTEKKRRMGNRRENDETRKSEERANGE